MNSAGRPRWVDAARGYQQLGDEWERGDAMATTQLAEIEDDH